LDKKQIQLEEKQMKKRSLFAAVAMLIVSAVVLTSATYAWFASGTEVTVSTVSADVSNSDGSIKISADGSNWKTNLANADLQAVASNILPAAFTPVSIQPSNLNVVAGSITDGAFAAGSASGGYIKFTCYVKADVDCSVTVAPTVSFGTGFIYAYVKAGDNAYKVANSAGAKYYPIINTTATATDANGNNIVDDSTHDAYTQNSLTTPTSYDTDISTGAFGGLVTPDGTTGSALQSTLSLTANTPETIVVYMWAEGQNTACTGTVDTATSSIGLTITKVASGGSGSNP
jgi:hypothetical protein